MLNLSDPPPSASRLPGPAPRSPAQAAASRANAKGSTGPRTRLGKLHIRHNGVRHGLYTATAPMMGERRRDYAHVLERLTTEFLPDTPFEESLVSRAASLVWRLGRAPAAENALFESFGAEAARALREDDGAAGEGASDAEPTDVAVDLLWGLSFRAGNVDSPVNRLARWERGLHRQLREVMAELRASQAARWEQAEQPAAIDAMGSLLSTDKDRDEIYSALDTYIAVRDSALTRKELEDEVIRLRAQLAARDGLPPPVAPLHQVGNTPRRRAEEVESHAFTRHIKGKCHGRNWDWSPAPEEAAHIQALIADALGRSVAAARAAPSTSPPPQEETDDGAGAPEDSLAWEATAEDARPVVFARDPSPEEAARGLPPGGPDSRADTALMDREKWLKR